MTHDFHFIVNEKIYLELIKLSKSIKKNISKTIIEIFVQILPFVERNHLMSKEKKSKYQVLSYDSENRNHIHCYMDEKLYRKLKQIYHDLNVFSLAQIIRRMIESFLRGCKNNGINEFINRMKKIKKIWEEKKLTYRNKNRKFLRHLLKNNNSNLYCLTAYGYDSRPYYIQLL